MTLGSFFDGIGGWQLAAVRAGILPIWSSDIEPFPLAVTRVHFPDTIQIGDITKIDTDKLPAVDIICAGSPCQDLSIAGTRRGLHGNRSGLFRTAVQHFHALRRRTGRPRFFVWENVPGAFSSNGGGDFRAVLKEIGKSEIPMPDDGKWAEAGMAELPHCQIAWRTLDAQFFGVAQRRRRIFLVADFGSGERCETQILFEPQGVRGNFAESLGAEQGPSAATCRCASQTSRPFIESDDKTAARICAYDIAHRSDVVRTMDRKSVTLTSRMGTGGHNVPIVQEAYTIAGNIIDRKPGNGGNGIGCQKGKSYTLTAFDRHAVARILQEKSGTLCACDAKGISNQYVDTRKIVSAKGSLRRLTPLECERLQGLPDHYTNIDDST